MDETNNQQPQSVNTQNAAPEPIYRSQPYHMGWNNFNGFESIFEWGQDNKIRLFDIKPEGPQLVFECAPNQIDKAKINISILELTVSGKKYKLDFAQTSSMNSATFGVAGFVGSEMTAKEDGILWWQGNLEKQGVKVRRVSSAKTIFIYAPLLLIGISLVLLVLGLIIRAFS